MIWVRSFIINRYFQWKTRLYNRRVKAHIAKHYNPNQSGVKLCPGGLISRSSSSRSWSRSLSLIDYSRPRKWSVSTSVTYDTTPEYCAGVLVRPSGAVIQPKASKPTRHTINHAPTVILSLWGFWFCVWLVPINCPDFDPLAVHWHGLKL